MTSEAPASEPSARPTVDVAVVTWNTADVTPEALRRLLDSDQGCHIRLLVRDNASADGTAEAIRRAAPEADVDAGSQNLGFAAGMNTLIARSTAPWLFLLNPDAWPLEGAIGALVQAAQNNPRAAAIAPRLEHPDGRLQHSTHPFPSVRVASTVAFSWNRLSRARAEELFLEGAWKHDRPRKLDWAHGAALLIRRAALEDIGPLDESFFMYAEDLEWCWRARTRGWEIWFEPSAVVRHIANVSGAKQFGTRRTSAHMHNALRFYARAHGVPAAAAWWAVNVAGAASRWMGAISRRQASRERYWRRELAAYLTAPLARDRRARSRSPARGSRI